MGSSTSPPSLFRNVKAQSETLPLQVITLKIECVGLNLIF